MSRLSIRSAFAAAFLVSAALPAGSRQALFSRQSIPKSLPAAITGNTRAAISDEGQRVTAGGAPLAVFWLRREIPRQTADDRVSPVLGEKTNFSRLPPAVLVGFVQFERPWLDYRNREIPSGLYTMRYALQPAIKEHRGVSIFRDFLVLIPVDRDRSLDRPLSEVIAESIAFFGRGHPAVLALFPTPKALELPSIAKNDLGEEMLAVKVGAEAIGIALSAAGTKTYN